MDHFVSDLVENHEKECMKKIINSVIPKILRTCEKEVPYEIMSTPKGSILLYDIFLNLLCRSSCVLKVTREQLKNQIDAFFNMMEGDLN